MLNSTQLGAVLLSAALLLLLTDTCRAVPPTIISSQLLHEQTGIQGGSDYHLLYIMTEFDQPVQVKRGDVIASASALNGLQDGVNEPLSVLFGNHIAKFQCFGHTYTTDAPTLKTMITPASLPGGALVLAPSVIEPGPVMMGLYSGVFLNETQYNNRINLILVLNVDGTDYVTLPQNGQTGSCHLSFTTPSTSGYNAATDFIVTNAANQAVANSASFTQFNYESCSSLAFASTKQVINLLMGQTLTTSNPDEMNNMVQTWNSIYPRMGFNGCRGILFDFFQTQDVALSVGQSADCPVPWNTSDPVWVNDPCCNSFKRMDTCCIPRSVTATVQQVASINTQKIQQTCSNPNQIAAVLYDFVNQQSLASTFPDLDVQSLSDSLQTFTNVCRDKVTSQTCNSDSQCQYGPKKCAGTVCDVNWGDEGVDIAACYLQEMPLEMRFELKSMWGLPPVFNSTDDEIAAIAQEFENRLYSFDCVGPNAFAFQKQDNWVYNSTLGYSVNDVIPGNQTACLQQHSCNFDSTLQTEQECLAGSNQEFCGDCNGGWCSSLTSWPRCESSFYSDSSSCQVAGGSWDNQFHICLMNATTHNDCVTPQFCWNLTEGTDAWACNFPMCFDPNSTITNHDDCATYGSNHPGTGAGWNSPTKACLMANYNNDKTQCEANNYTWFDGRYFRPGQFYTQERCQIGLCNNPAVQPTGLNPVTAEICANSNKCTTPCRKCKSATSQSFLCVDPTRTLPNQCLSQNGYQFYNESGQVACASNSYTTNATCTGAGLLWLTCEGSDRDHCRQQTGAYQPIMQCFWNEWADCDTQDECLASGQCDDFDFISPCTWNPQSCADANFGVCFRPRDFTNPNDQCINGVETYARQGCIVTTLTNQTVCEANANYKWYSARAANQTECTDRYGQSCKSPDLPGVNVKNATECAKCQGTQQPFYNWQQPQWTPGQMKQLQWLNKTFASVNRWQMTLDYSKLNDAIQSAVMRIIGRELYNQYAQKVNAILPYLERVACSCTGSSTGCVDGVLSSELGRCIANPGSGSDCLSLLHLNNNTFPDNSTTSVTMVQVPANNFVTGDVSAGSMQVGDSLSDQVQVLSLGPSDNDKPLKKRDAASNSAAYAVISCGTTVIGQLIGNGLSFSFSSENQASFELCLDINPSISQNRALYPKYDFANATSTFAPGLPLNMTVQVRGLKLCGNVTSSGTYFPVLTKLQYSLIPTYSTSTPAPAPSTPPKSFAGASVSFNQFLIVLPMILFLFM